MKAGLLVGKIRGGKATLYCKVENQRDTVEFYIRGTNPTEQAVKDYINEQGYDLWFLTRLIRQESNYLHFNTGTNYGPNWDNTQGCPNWGPPHGWGLMQLDALNQQIGDHFVNNRWRPPAQALWDWKTNIDLGYNFLTEEKWGIANNWISRQMTQVNRWNADNPDDPIEHHPDQEEGQGTRIITYTHAASPNFNYTWGRLPVGLRSFIDAVWIKGYNGNSNGYYYSIVVPQDPVLKPYWELRRTNNDNHNYVGAVSGRQE